MHLAPLVEVAALNFALNLGDCFTAAGGLASLDDRSIDHFITDPPFEAEAHTKARRIKRNGWRHMDPKGNGSTFTAPLDFAPITEEQRSAVAAQMARIARRWILVFCQLEAAMLWRWALEDGGAIYKRTGIWDKPNGQPQLTGDRPGVGYECIVVAHATEGRTRWNSGGKCAKWKHSSCHDGLHPTGKPLPLMSELVADFTDRGNIICDPFAGSGTTGVAALMAGRKFLGWELDPKHYETARRRLKDTREQASLLETAAPKSEQLALLGK